MPEASREELNALGESLREALSADRSERVEHLTRIETKFDTRMDAFYQILADYKEKTGDQAARLAVLEKAMGTHLDNTTRRFEEVQREVGRRIEDLIHGGDKRIADIQTGYDKRLAVIEKRQERNWGWIMGIIAGIVILIIQAGWSSFNKQPQVRQVDHVHDATGKEIPVPKAIPE